MDVKNLQVVEANTDEIDISELIRPLWFYRWYVITFTLFITFLFSVYATALKPSYKATALLQMIDNIPEKKLTIDSVFDDKSRNNEQTKTHFKLMQSRAFAKRVVTGLGLVEIFSANSGAYKREFLSAFAIEDSIQLTEHAAINILIANMSLTAIPSTDLVEISYVAYDPVLAQRVANYIGQTYIAYQDELHESSNENTAEWLATQLEELGHKLEFSEKALQRFREEQQIVDLSSVVDLVSIEINELALAVIESEKKADELETKVSFIEENKEDLSTISTLPEVYKDPKYIKLNSILENIEIKLAQRFGPKHPDLISLKEDLASVNDRISTRIKEIISFINKKHNEAKANIQLSKTRLSSAKQRFLTLNRLNNEFSQLQREVDTYKELYSAYLVRLKEADAMGNYKSEFHVKFIDEALIPKEPIKPHIKLIITLGFILGLMLSCLIVFVRGMTKDTLNSKGKVDSINDTPVLAVLPKIKLGSPKIGEQHKLEDNLYVEAIRALRTNLLFTKNKTPPKIIAITSSEPGEGKSTVALELARSLGEMEKVLLIEGDLRHPSLARSLNLKENKPGLSNLLANTHKIDQCITRDSGLKLDILTSGIRPNNPLAFLSMKRFNLLIDTFSNFYDRIIIETPPVNAVSDAVVIAKLVDSLMYIVHAEKTKREQITSGLNLLKQVQVPVDGIILNQSENIDKGKYKNKYYNAPSNIIKLASKRTA